MGLFTEKPSFQEKVEAAFASVIAAGKLRVSDQTPKPFVNDCRLIVLENHARAIDVPGVHLTNVEARWGRGGQRTGSRILE